jgi:hypothetical protein
MGFTDGSPSNRPEGAGKAEERAAPEAAEEDRGSSVRNLGRDLPSTERRSMIKGEGW